MARAVSAVGQAKKPGVVAAGVGIAFMAPYGNGIGTDCREVDGGVVAGFVGAVCKADDFGEAKIRTAGGFECHGVFGQVRGLAAAGELVGGRSAAVPVGRRPGAGIDAGSAPGYIGARGQRVFAGLHVRLTELRPIGWVVSSWRRGAMDRWCSRSVCRRW